MDMSRMPRVALANAAPGASAVSVGLALAHRPPRTIADTVGRTPLVELRRMTAGCAGRVAVKLESRNPTSSVKDRVAAALFDEAEQAALLHPQTTIVAATSGNTGLALAQRAAARGLRVRLAVPEDWVHERLALLLYLGADVVMTRGGGMRAAMDRAREIAESTPGALLLDQFRSAANPEVHRRTTAHGDLEGQPRRGGGVRRRRGHRRDDHRRRRGTARASARGRRRGGGAGGVGGALGGTPGGARHPGHRARVRSAALPPRSRRPRRRR